MNLHNLAPPPPTVAVRQPAGLLLLLAAAGLFVCLLRRPALRPLRAS